MSDTAKSWILRAAVMLPGFLAIIILVGITDEIIDRLSQHYTGRARPNQIEILVFCFWLARRLLNWTERRVWIGTPTR